MNTEHEPADSVVDFSGEPPAGAEDIALARVQQQLESEKDSRKEERFLWIVTSILLVDVLWFRGSANAALPLVALVLELIALLILARRMQIDEIAILISNLVNKVGQRAGGEGA